MTNCEYENRCTNNNKCFRCNNNNLLKLKEDKFKKRKNTNRNVIKANSEKDSWKDLEQTVANNFSNVPSIKEADNIYNSEDFNKTIKTIEEMTESRRTRRSGAMWFETGDVKDTIMHPECKERTGTTLKTGDKSMSVKKSWLNKAKKECENNEKKMCLPFRFKGDEDIYVIMDFEDLTELVTELKSYKIEIDTLRRQVKNEKSNG